MDYARMLLPAAMRKKDDSFTIDLAITDSNLTFGVTPYWNAGGWCNILDWGDGQSQAATTSGTQLTHTYAEAGSYRVKVRGDMYRFRVGSTNPAAVIDCNGNWEALGDITSLESMFAQNSNCAMHIRDLPRGDITALKNAFFVAGAAIIDLDAITASAPANGWSATSISQFAYGVSMAIGSVANFMRKLPNVSIVQSAFGGTSATTFGTSDYFEITLTTTEANQSWGFTATSSAGRWYCFDWGDGTPVVAKNLNVFTSGTKVSHTFATPGTYHIKLATAPCQIEFDPYDSDNGNWAALGLPADGLGGVFVKSGTAVLSSAMVMSGATITSGQSQMVYNRGSALYTTIESGGSLSVQLGGVAGFPTVNSGRIDQNGGTIYSADMNGGTISVSSGIISNTIVDGLGQMTVRSMGVASGVTGKRVIIVDTIDGGAMYDVVLSSGGGRIRAGGSMYRVEVGGGVLTVSAGGYAESVTVVGSPIRGVIGVLGVVSGATILSGCTLTVSSGGTALAVTSNAGATVNVLDGGYIEYA